MENTDQGLPCLSFLVENHNKSINDKDNTIKLTSFADISINGLNKLNTDGLSPISNQLKYQQRRNGLDLDNDEYNS